MAGMFILVRNFLDFIRAERCVFFALLGALGFLAFGEPSGALLLALGASFLGCAGGCALNSITDIREDLANKRRISPFSRSRQGILLAAGTYAAGLAVALALSPWAALMFAAIAASGIVYSFMGVKRTGIPGAKNAFGALAGGLFFLMGAGEGAIADFLLIVPLLFIISVTSDTVDVRGDRAAGVATLPAWLGSRMTGAVLLAIAAAWLAAGGRAYMVPMALVLAASSLIAASGHSRKAQLVARSSYLPSTLWLLASPWFA